MKKFLSVATAVLMLVCLLACVGCAPKEPLVIKETDKYIVIKASASQMELTETTTLANYMKSLKADKQLEFELDGKGMVSSINGIANPADYSSCWMLYTDDAANSNVAWGQIEYKDKIYGSAALGAEQLIVKEGCTYIWVYQSF